MEKNHPGMNIEQKIYDNFIKNYDNKAIHYGGMNSSTNDIISPNYGNVEAKGIPAQCGQFTFTTANDYEYSQEVMANPNNEDICIKWIKNYYQNHKKVNYFATYENNDIFKLYTIDDFFQNFKFFCTCRAKKSGSRKAPKYLIDKLPAELEAYWDNDHLMTNHSEYFNSYFPFINTKGEESIAWVSNKSIGEIRVLSNTKNLTYIFSVNKKDD